MRVVSLFLVVLLGISSVGCALFRSQGDLDLASVEAIDKRYDKMAPQYIKYVEADPAFGGPGLTDDERKDAKEDEKKTVESVGRLIDSVKNRLKED